MRKVRFSRGWLLIGLAATVMAVGGCSPAVRPGGGAGPVSVSTPAVTAVVPSSTTMAPATVQLGDMAVTFTARVAEVAASARLITFAEPVEGYGSAALTETSQIVATDAAPLGLQDVKPGMSVQVTGRPGGSNAVLAEQIVVLGAGMAPAAGQPAPTVTSTVTGQLVDIPDLGLAVNVPAGWQRQGMEWSWTAPAQGPAAGARIGVNWNEMSPGWQETGMLPNHAKILYQKALDLGWAAGTAYTLQTQDPAAQGSAITGLERHLIIKVSEKLAADFFATAPDSRALEEADALLRQAIVVGK